MTDELGAHLRNGFDAQLNITSNQNQYLTKSFNVMKKLFTTSILLIIVASLVCSCSSSKTVGYNKNLYKRYNGCMLSDEGCGWANKAKK